MRRVLRSPAVLLLVVSAQAATISGTVYLRAGDTRRPLAGVRVMARADYGSELFQSTESDPQGRYLLVNLPRRRISLSAAKASYFTRAVACREPRLIVDLAADETLAGADFEVLPGGVITGRVTDPLGDPLEGVQMGVWRITYFGGRHRMQAGSASTDDRGTYRIFGLEPGRHILLARPIHRLGEQRAVALYYPGRSEESRAEEIEVVAGAEVIGIDMVLGAEPSYRISGKIVEVEPEQLSHIYVQAVTADRHAPGNVSSFSMVDADGNFTLPGLPAGSYVLTASERTGIARGDKIFARQRIDLRANLTNLLVRPGRPGYLTGRLTIPEAAHTRSLPEQFRLRVLDKSNLQTAESVARAPDYRFEFPGLWPGTYVFELVSPAHTYMRSLRQGGRPIEPLEITLSEAGSAAVELEVGFGVGRVSGVAKAPGGRGALSHARVALARPATSPVEFQTVQADQRGRWILPDVRPGEYMICVWHGVEVEALYGPETWERAGSAVKRFVVEPGAEIEVELTAVDPKDKQQGSPQRPSREEKTR